MPQNYRSEDGNFKTFFYIIIGVATVLLIIANSSFWFNRYIFNTQNFTEVAIQSITSESSRTAIATGITDRILVNRPVLKELVDDQSVKLLTGLLDSERVAQLLTRVVQRLQTAMISQNPEPIEVDLTTLKTTITAITSLSTRITGNAPETAVNVADIPDTLTLVDFERLPNIYQLVSTLAWLGPLSLILGIVLFSIPLFQTWHARNSFIKTLSVEGIALLIGAFIAFLMGPIFKPAVLSRVATINGRIVVENLYEAFLETFNDHTLYMVYSGLLFLFFAGVTWLLLKRSVRLAKKENR